MALPVAAVLRAVVALPAAAAEEVEQIKHVLQWHLTHQCNLRCKHCYQEEYKSDLSFETCKRVFDEYIIFLQKRNDTGHINFTGGEPFLSENLFPMLELCEKERISFGILTNGTLLTKEMVQILKKFEMLNFVQVSIDGTRKTHDEIRGKGNYDRTMKACKRLQSEGIQTMASFTCHKLNFQDLSKVIRSVRFHRIDRFWADRLIPIDEQKEIGKEMLVSTQEYQQFVSVLRRESQRKIPFCHTVIHTNRALQFDISGNDIIYTCSAGNSLLTLLADGTLLPCRRMPIPLGNVKEYSLEEILETSEVIKKLSQREIPKQCEKCPKASLCRGGAKCLSYALTGSYLEKDINCFYNY